MDPIWILVVGMAVVVGGILALRLHAFLALIAGALVVAALTPGHSLMDAGPRVAVELGKTAGKIGILIAMAAVIGKCLLDSGAAERIVTRALKFVGERLAPAAFVGAGFVLGVPVYFDTLFYLLIPLAKSMGARRPSEYGRYVMGIIAGGSMAHSLVPPTPGPLLVANELGVDIGTMMLAGIVVGAITAASGYVYAAVVNPRRPLPLREIDAPVTPTVASAAGGLPRKTPSLLFSVLPILLPVFLIGGASVLKQFEPGDVPDAVLWFFNTFGEKNLALIVAAAFALWLLARATGTSLKTQSTAVGSALSGAGVIILITSAGGAFGGVLQQTGISERIGAFAADGRIGLLPLAFFLTTLIRTAQGSATVAMITTVGIVASIAPAGGLGFHPVYLALAIGCGSKPFPWMNDSGFWVIGRMSGFTERETFRAFSFLLTVMALTGLVVIMIAARLWPMV